MTSSATKGRMSLASAALAIAVTLAFAFPAQAETMTVSCEGEITGNGASGPRNWTVDIDYAAKTMKWEVPEVLTAFEHPAVITYREITFSYRRSNVSIEGRMDRLDGKMNAKREMFEPRERISFQGRCRPAARPDW